MRFIRFVLARRHEDSGVEDGAFGLAYELRDSRDVEPTDRELLAETLSWFEKSLETPTRFNRTKSKGFYRRNTRGIARFKDTATAHLGAHAPNQGGPGAVRVRGGHAVRIADRIGGAR